MARRLIKLLRVIRHPHIHYLLHLAKEKGLDTNTELCGYDFWPVLIQSYGSNRKKGYNRMNAIEKTLKGYSCYEIWEIPL